MVIYAHDENGGFMVGDTDAGTACYAYPTSINAVQAKKNPSPVAHEMIRDVNAFAIAAPAAYAKTTWANGEAQNVINRIIAVA